MTEPAVIVLGAGKSRRFEGNKLIAPLALKNKKQTIIQATWHSLTSISEQPSLWIDPVNEALITLLKQNNIPFHTAKTCDQGMGSTLAEAVRNHRDATGWIICLADMPCIKPATLKEIRGALTFKSIVRPQYRGINGHPVAFGQAFYPELIKVTGDQGAREIVAKHSAQVTQVETDDEGILIDVDTTADLARVNQIIEHRD